MTRFLFEKEDGKKVVLKLREFGYACPRYQTNEQKAQEKYCSFTIIPPNTLTNYDISTLVVSSYIPETTAIIKAMDVDPLWTNDNLTPHSMPFSTVK